MGAERVVDEVHATTRPNPSQPARQVADQAHLPVTIKGIHITTNERPWRGFSLFRTAALGAALAGCLALGACGPAESRCSSGESDPGTVLTRFFEAASDGNPDSVAPLLQLGYRVDEAELDTLKSRLDGVDLANLQLFDERFGTAHDFRVMNNGELLGVFRVFAEDSCAVVAWGQTDDNPPNSASPVATLGR